MDEELYQKLKQGETGFISLPRALWKLTGGDRVRYLNGQVTNDVAKLPVGEALYAATTTAKGRMVGDLFVAASTDALWIDAEPELQESLDARLQKYLIADDALLEDVTDQWKLIHIFGSELPKSTSENFVFKNPRFGLSGFDLWRKKGDRRPETGDGKSDLGFQVSPEIVETLRLENGIPKWGAEMTEETLPPEAGLDRNGISYTKGCYVGQETIARIKSIGHVNKVLVLLESADSSIPQLGDELKVEDKVVGKITSAGYSPSLKKGIALGYVQRQFGIEGQEIGAADSNFKVRLPKNQ